MSAPHLHFLLGTDDEGGWHQRIIQADTLEYARCWWKEQIDRVPEVAISLPDLEAATGALAELGAAIENASAGNLRLFGVWCVDATDQIQLFPIAARDEQQAQTLFSQHHFGCQAVAIVDPAPLLGVVARMRAVAAGELEADEILRPQGR